MGGVVRVLVVEDDVYLASQIAAQLRKRVAVVIAHSASEAQALIVEPVGKLGGALVDYWLGDGTGVSVIRELRRSQSYPHVLVMTGGRPTPEVVSSIYNLDAFFALKPLSASTLDHFATRCDVLPFERARPLFAEAGLTARQVNILRVCFETDSRIMAAHKLSISESTLSTTLGRILKKLDVKNLEQLAKLLWLGERSRSADSQAPE